ncbi:MAG TPA: hypothetical protein VMY77_16845 [Chitinophagaceae bacterium]|nr:hypothetical protein [Chitinophagaceae bacterium]
MIETFKNKIEKLNHELSKEQLSNIHYRSVNNFLQYFDQLKSDSIKQEVIVLLGEYFYKIEEMNYEFTKSESNEIFNYIMKIGTLYKLSFKFSGLYEA